MANLGEAYVEIRADTSKFRADLNAAVKEQVTQAETASRQFGDKFAAGLGAAQKSLADLGKKATATGKQLSMKLTLPLVGLGTAAFKASADFDKSMSMIVGLVGVAREEVEGWKDDVERLGATYGTSSKEAADALFFITSAGLRGKDAMDTLEASLRAAATGLGDTATIADLATSAMNAYGSNVLSASGATDVMVATVREGKLEASELTGAMGSVLPIASAMGVSFNEVGATFASLSRTGTNASQASTQLRGILSALLKPTKQARDQLAELGLSAGGLRTQIQEEGLLAALTTLTDAFGDNEEAQAKVFGNVRALAGIMDLMGANVEGTRAIFESMTDVTGDSAAAFDVLSESTGFKMKKAFAEIQLSLKQFGDIIAPVVVRVAQAIGSLVAKFQSMSDESKKRIAIVAGALALLGPALIIIGKLSLGLSAVLGVMKFVVLTTQALTGATVASTAATKLAAAITKVWSGAQMALNAVMSANPIALVVLAVGALVAAFVIAYKKSETFREIVQAAMEKIREVVSAVVDRIVAAWNYVWEAVQPVIEAVRSAFEVAFEAIKGYLSFLVSFWTAVFKGIWSVAEPIIKGIWIAFQAAFEIVKRVFLVYRDIALSVFRAVSAAVSAVASWIADRFRFAVGVVSKIIDWLRDKFGGTFSKIAEVAGTAFRAIPALLTSVINGVIGGVESGINKAIGGINKLIRAANKLPFVNIAEVAEVSFGRVSIGVDSATRSLGELSHGLGDAHRATIDQMRANKAAKDANDAMKRSLEGTGKAAQKGKDDLEDFNNEADPGTTKAAGSAKEKVESFAEALKSGLSDAVDEAKGHLESARKAFDSFASSVSDAILKAFSFGDALESGETTGDGFVNGLERSLTKVTEYAAKVDALLQAGLSQQALQQVLATGVESGTKIADQLIAGGEAAILRTNALVDAARTAANKVGQKAAGQYLQSGIDFAAKVVEGLQAELDRLTPSLMAKMDAIAKRMGRTVDVVVRVTEIVNRVTSGAGSPPGMADGGIVPGRPGGHLAVIGEAGTEAVIPITRPARALELMEQSGLADLVRGQASMSAAVEIGTAVFQTPSDADLVAQKVVAAWRTRSGV